MLFSFYTLKTKKVCFYETSLYVRLHDVISQKTVTFISFTVATLTL